MKDRIDLRIPLTAKETAAWNSVRHVISKHLRGGAVLKFIEFEKKNPAKAKLIRAKAKVFSEILEMVGE